MKYFITEPVADGELGEDAVIDFDQKPRKPVVLHVYLFGYPESDLIQIYPIFLVSTSLKTAMERTGITGALFLPCKVSKSPQYEELSETLLIPEMWCLEPVGEDEVDDLVFHSETEIKTSSRFVELLKYFSKVGCVVTKTANHKRSKVTRKTTPLHPRRICSNTQN